MSHYHYHKFNKKYDKPIEQSKKENLFLETTEKKRDQKNEKPFAYKVSFELKGIYLPFIHNFIVPFDKTK